MSVSARQELAPRGSGGWPPSASFALTAIACFVALLMPGLLNGAPLQFPDTFGYLTAGEAAWNAAGRVLGWLDVDGGGTANGVDNVLGSRARDGISTIRSPYYGVLLVLSQRLGGTWGMAVLQAAIASVSLALVLRRLEPRTAGLALSLFALSLSGVGFFAVAALPDAFTGLMLLAVAMLAGGISMSGRERVWWLGIVLLSALFHKAHVALLAVLIGLALLPAWRRRWSGSQVPALAAVLLIGVVGHACVTIVVERISGQRVIEPPILMARVIADGPGTHYLKDHCPQAGHATCAWAARLPSDVNTLLWSRDKETGFFGALGLAEKRRVAGEANGIVMASVAAHPVQQLSASLGNFAEQLVVVGITQFGINTDNARAAAGGTAAASLPVWPETAIGRGAIPLALVSGVMLLVYLASAGVGLATVAFARPDLAPVRLAAWLLAGMLANAAVNGVLAGVFDRYQGRVAWLAVIAALAALAVWRQRAAAQALTGAP
jgi:hypothetical protein